MVLGRQLLRWAGRRHNKAEAHAGGSEGHVVGCPGLRGWGQHVRCGDQRKRVVLGRDLPGQPGDGTTKDRLTPVPVHGISEVAATDNGLEHSCALLRGGTVWCRGDDTYGEFGNGTTKRRYVLGPVSGLSLVSAIFNRHGRQLRLARRRDLMCWGAGNPLAAARARTSSCPLEAESRGYRRPRPRRRPPVPSRQRRRTRPLVRRPRPRRPARSGARPPRQQRGQPPTRPWMRRLYGHASRVRAAQCDRRDPRAPVGDGAPISVAGGAAGGTLGSRRAAWLCRCAPHRHVRGRQARASRPSRPSRASRASRPSRPQAAPTCGWRAFRGVPNGWRFW